MMTETNEPTVSVDKEQDRSARIPVIDPILMLLRSRRFNYLLWSLISAIATLFLLEAPEPIKIGLSALVVLLGSQGSLQQTILDAKKIESDAKQSPYYGKTPEEILRMGAVEVGEVVLDEARDLLLQRFGVNSPNNDARDTNTAERAVG